MWTITKTGNIKFLDTKNKKVLDYYDKSFGLFNTYKEAIKAKKYRESLNKKIWGDLFKNESN